MKGDKNHRFGKHLTEEQKEYLRKNNANDKSVNWRGEKAKYRAIHMWVAKWKGKAYRCEMCGSEEPKRYGWANVDHKYRRVLEDYISMCGKCHSKYDSKLKITNKKIWQKH